MIRTGRGATHGFQRGADLFAGSVRSLSSNAAVLNCLRGHSQCLEGASGSLLLAGRLPPLPRNSYPLSRELLEAAGRHPYFRPYAE